MNNTSSLGNNLTPKKKVQPRQDISFSSVGKDGKISGQAGVEVATPIANQPIKQGGIPTSPNPPQTNPSSINPIDTSWMGNKSTQLGVSPTNIKATEGTANATPTTPPTVETQGANIIANANAGIKSSQDYQKQLDATGKEAIATKATSTDAEVKAQEAFATGTDEVNRQRIENEKLYQAQYVNEQERQKNQALNTLKPLLDTQVTRQNAEITNTQAKNEQAEYEMKVANEVTKQNAMSALNKLGFTLTGGAVNTAMGLDNLATYRMAELKTRNSYNIAKLRESIGNIEFEHQLKINSIVDTANSNVIEKKKTTVDAIAKIQDNILLTQKEKVEKIGKLKSDYQDYKLKTEAGVYAGIKDSNTYINSQLDRVTSQLDKDRTRNLEKVSSLIKNGQWDKLSATEKAKLAEGVGKTVGELEGEKTSAVYSAINTSLQALLGEGFTIRPESSKILFDSVMSYMSMGQSLTQAIQSAMNTNIKKLPEYAESQAYQASKREVSLAKERESIRASQSNTALGWAELAGKNALNTAQIEKMQYEQTKASKEEGSWKTLSATPNDDGYFLQANAEGEIRYTEAPVVKTPQQWATTKGVSLLDAPDGEKYPSRLSMAENPSGLKQCAEFANDLTGHAGAGKYYEDRLKQFQKTDSPVVGMQVLFPSTDSELKKYGHVAVVTKVNNDGTIEIKEANFKGQGEVGTRTVDISKADGFLATPLSTKVVESGKEFEDLDAFRKKDNPKDVTYNLLGKLGIKANDTDVKQYQSIVGEALKSGASGKDVEGVLQSTLLANGTITPMQAYKTKYGKDFVFDKEYPAGFLNELSVYEDGVKDLNKAKQEIMAIKDTKGQLVFGNTTGKFKNNDLSKGDYYVKSILDSNGKESGFQLRRVTEDNWVGDDDDEVVLTVGKK